MVVPTRLANRMRRVCAASGLGIGSSKAGTPAVRLESPDDTTGASFAAAHDRLRPNGVTANPISCLWLEILDAPQVERFSRARRHSRQPEKMADAHRSRVW